MKNPLRKIVLALALLLAFVVPAHAQDVTTQSLTLTVNPGTLTFTTSTLPRGQVAIPYASTSLVVAGGLGPYTFTVTSGTLPAGIVLATNGSLSGTPTTPGVSIFTVQAKDSEAPAVTTTQNFT